MKHTTGTWLDRMVARRNSAAWREHIVRRSVDVRDSEAPLVWSRTWLQRRLRVPGPTGIQHGNG